jgi:hypothetical protein
MDGNGTDSGPAPSLLGAYARLKVLGRGNFGQVVLGRHQQQGKQVMV